LNGANHIAIAPAKSGRKRNPLRNVIIRDHKYVGILYKDFPGTWELIKIATKLIAPKIDEVPAKCKLKIAKSILGNSDMLVQLVSVNPAAAPTKVKVERIHNTKEGPTSKNETLFMRENEYSWYSVINGKM
jgi:hypothetical protein